MFLWVCAIKTTKTDIHNGIMDIHNCIMDIRDWIMNINK